MTNSYNNSVPTSWFKFPYLKISGMLPCLSSYSDFSSQPTVFGTLLEKYITFTWSIAMLKVIYNVSPHSE